MSHDPAVCSASGAALGSARDLLRRVRARERRRCEVLRTVRQCAHARVPELRAPACGRRPLLRRVRLAAGSGGRAACGYCTGRGTAARLGPVRRSRRVHGALGATRRRGSARAPLALLRHLQPIDQALRRDGREVHRRCSDGRLGDTDRHRGRRRARRPLRARPGGGGLRARRRGRRARPPRAGRGAHRRGSGDDRRREPGHGRRRPRQHSLAHPVGGRARHGPRRRGDPADDRADDRLRECRLARR